VLLLISVYVVTSLFDLTTIASVRLHEKFPTMWLQEYYLGVGAVYSKFMIAWFIFHMWKKIQYQFVATRGEMNQLRCQNGFTAFTPNYPEPESFEAVFYPSILSDLGSQVFLSCVFFTYLAVREMQLRKTRHHVKHMGDIHAEINTVPHLEAHAGVVLKRLKEDAFFESRMVTEMGASSIVIALSMETLLEHMIELLGDCEMSEDVFFLSSAGCDGDTDNRTDLHAARDELFWTVVFAFVVTLLVVIMHKGFIMAGCEDASYVGEVEEEDTSMNSNPTLEMQLQGNDINCPDRVRL